MSDNENWSAEEQKVLQAMISEDAYYRRAEEYREDDDEEEEIEYKYSQFISKKLLAKANELIVNLRIKKVYLSSTGHDYAPEEGDYYLLNLPKGLKPDQLQLSGTGNWGTSLQRKVTWKEIPEPPEGWLYFSTELEVLQHFLSLS